LINAAGRHRNHFILNAFPETMPFACSNKQKHPYDDRNTIVMGFL
jgi:hypothetical protein